MSTDPLIGRRLANFQIERPLGRGGMAQVYYGQDVKLRRPVAIKVIDARFRDEPTYAKRFVREAQSIATWRHENIVQIYYADDQEGFYYYVMEYIDGGDLSDLMAGYRDKGELIPHKEVIRIGQAIAGALDYAHKQGLIHRDVKPANVMVANDGRVVVTDFGLAMDVEMGSMGEVFGSARYVAPEQARNSANAVPQSDLYALGIVLYEMLTGKVPFDDPSSAAVAIQHLTLPPPPPRQVNPEIDEDTEAVLLKALSKSPEERFQTVQEFMDALEAALTGRAIMSPPNEQTTKAAVSPPLSPKTTPDRPPAATTPDKPPVTTPPVVAETAPQPATSPASGLDPKVMVGIGAAVVLVLLFIGFMAMGGDDETATPAAVSEATTAIEEEDMPVSEDEATVPATSEDTPGEAELLPTAEPPEVVAEPTPTPEPEPTVLADSSADFSETPTSWEYLWFNAREGDQWQPMQFYADDLYGRRCHYTNPNHVRICEGFGNPGNQDDLAWRWTSEVSGTLEFQVQARKVGNGGDGVKITVYRENIDSFPLFEGFTNQGLINQSLTVEDVSPAEQFYFVMNKNQTETLDDTEFNVKICHYKCP